MLGNPQNDCAVYKVIIDIEKDVTEMARTKVLLVFLTVRSLGLLHRIKINAIALLFIVGWIEVT